MILLGEFLPSIAVKNCQSISIHPFLTTAIINISADQLSSLVSKLHAKIITILSTTSH